MYFFLISLNFNDFKILTYFFNHFQSHQYDQPFWPFPPYLLSADFNFNSGVAPTLHSPYHEIHDIS